MMKTKRRKNRERSIMIRSLFATCIAAFLAFNSMAGVIVLTGSYQGKNLYVQNPFAGSGIGFCVFEVTVNGEISTDEINSSASHTTRIPDNIQDDHTADNLPTRQRGL